MISALFLPLMYRRPRTRQTLKKKKKNHSPSLPSALIYMQEKIPDLSNHMDKG